MIKCDHVWTALIFLLYCGCCSTSQLPSFERQLLNNGFHRDLSTTVEIPLSLFSHRNIQCYSICKEDLPSSIYVDTFQLKSISKHLGLQFVAPTLDIEKPEYQPETFSIFPVLIYSSVYVGPQSVLINVTLPIHLRYHLAMTDYRQFKIWKPQILLRCTNNADFIGEVLREEELPCTSDDKTTCIWNVLKYQSKTDFIPVMVPVGNNDHMILVVIGTLSVTFGSCLFIIIKVINTTKSKQS